MAMIQFVKNYEDLSTDKGFQFKFYCDKCGNGFMSRFQPSVTGTAGSLLRAAGGLFGGWASSAGDSAYEVQRAVGGKAHDAALQKAVEEGKEHFHQCSRCGRWVCPEVCWNASAGQCEECAPDPRGRRLGGAARRTPAAAWRHPARTLSAGAVAAAAKLAFSTKPRITPASARPRPGAERTTTAFPGTHCFHWTCRRRT